MHISDGILPAPVWIGGYAAAAALTASAARRLKPEEVPKVAVMTSAFFVASLVHVPLGPTSVHLVLNGLAGVLLGRSVFLCIFVGLALQAVLFQHGGITSLGCNAIMMGLPAFGARGVYLLRDRIPFRGSDFVFGFVAGAFGIFGGAVLLALLLMAAGSDFIGVVTLALLAHIPIMGIEGVVTGFVVSFLRRVKPGILEDGYGKA